MTLAERLGSRDNGVTPLRLAFAALVVFGHAYEIGGYGDDPLRRFSGVTCGEVGVNAFFALSGYLVTQSWLRSPRPVTYLRRRALRIFPGFWLCLLATGFGLFPWLWARAHHQSWLEALRSAPFASYVGRNALLRIRQPSIGNLFAGQPADGVANGSLWSLLPEFACYLAVAVAGVAGLLRPGRRAVLWLAAAAAFAAHVAGPAILAHLPGPIAGRAWYLWRVDTQACFFAIGALGCVYSGRIGVGAGRALAGAAILVAAAAAGAYAWAAPLALPWVVFQLAALLPGAWLERVGDYSYGVYVYHYPIAQALVFRRAPTGSGPGLFALTLALSLVAAAASWHAVEKPALRLK